jgi:hypothetical protein
MYVQTENINKKWKELKKEKNAWKNIDIKNQILMKEK